MGDGDRGRYALNMLGVRLIEPFQELPCVGGKTLDVSSLPFRIERVQRQAGLAAATDTAKSDEPLVGQIEVNTSEIVNPDPAQLNVICSQALISP